MLVRDDLCNAPREQNQVQQLNHLQVLTQHDVKFASKQHIMEIVMPSIVLVQLFFEIK